MLESMEPRKATDRAGLEAHVLGQGGYFDRGAARSHGLTDRLLTHHVGTSRFERVFPGVYRLRTAPNDPNDEYLQAFHYCFAIALHASLELNVGEDFSS